MSTNYANRLRGCMLLCDDSSMKFAIPILCIFIFLSGCMRKAIEGPEQAMRPAVTPHLHDQLDRDSLALALERSVSYLRRSPDSELVFGEKRILRADYARSLEALLHQVRSPANTKSSLLNYIGNNFEFMEIYGDKDWGELFLTAYFEPVIRGSLGRSEEFSQPLYRAPIDLLRLNLSDFGLEGERELRARVNDDQVLPYFSREEIDVGGRLASRGLEICWVTPLDAFFLQIQGSGVVLLNDGSELLINYADKNGHPYRAIGALLKERMAPIKPTMQNLREYISALSAAEQQAIFNQNPSYVFFVVGKSNALTASGVPATAGRTIAIDRKFFPKGALAFLDFNHAVESNAEGRVSANLVNFSRFVLDQDVGGAIKGPGRADLFWGRGPEAGVAAGALQSRARLYYLFPVIREKNLHNYSE